VLQTFLAPRLVASVNSGGNNTEQLWISTEELWIRFSNLSASQSEEKISPNGRS
jgi:hypothetical protein